MTRRIQDVFERVVVLNLDRRPDRLAAIGAELARLKVPFERMPAVDGQHEPVLARWQAYVRQPLVAPAPGEPAIRTYREFYLEDHSPCSRVAFVEQRDRGKAIATPGAFGLLLSMTRIAERALEEGWPSVLILEDDVLFHRATARLFDQACRQLPADWVILQLGAMQLHWDDGWVERCSENLYRCHGSSIGAHAVGLRREAFEPLVAACARADLPFDIGALHEVKRRYRERCFTILPNLAIQDAGDSDIGMSELFFREARRPGNLYRWHLPDYGPGSLAKDDGEGAEMAQRARHDSGVAKSVVRTVQQLVARARPALRSESAIAPPVAGTPKADAAPRGQQPLRAHASSRPDSRCVLAVVVGVPLDRLETLLGGLTSSAGTVPVFLTDDDRFEIFRRHRAVFEYLPPIDPAPDLDVELYRLRRLALLRRKWQPSKIIAFGPAAARLVQVWRTSPFEDRRIIELTGGASPAGVSHDPLGV